MDFLCGLVVISYTEVANYHGLHSVDLFFSIRVSLDIQKSQGGRGKREGSIVTPLYHYYLNT